jgi:poly(3-hydroxyalkanoate) depolymerase
MCSTAESPSTGRIPRWGRRRPQMRTVVVGQTPLRIAVRPGTGAGPPLLLANGIGASLETFDPFVAALDPAIEVIRFDVPGVGGSPLPARPYRFSTLARLLAGLLDELGHESADILGISWGGALAQQFALSAAPRCRRLVLVATGTGMLMVPGSPWVLARLATPRRYLDLEYTRQIAGPLYGGTARHDIERIVAVLHPWTRLGPSRGYLYQLAAGMGWTSLPLLPLIRQPTLVLAGDDDPIIPLVNARMLAGLIPHARLHVYHGGHVELVLRPDLLAPLVGQFLTGPGQPMISRGR